MNAWNANMAGATTNDGKVESSMDGDKSDTNEMEEEDNNDLNIDELAVQLMKPPAHAYSALSSSTSSVSVKASVAIKTMALTMSSVGRRIDICTCVPVRFLCHRVIQAVDKLLALV